MFHRLDDAIALTWQQAPPQQAYRFWNYLQARLGI